MIPSLLYINMFYRIEACCTFRTFQGSLVREGEVGGWIESNKNLSQSKFSWVLMRAKYMEIHRFSMML